MRNLMLPFRLKHSPCVMLDSVHLQALMWYADPRSVGNNFAEISVAVDEVVMLLQQLLHL